MARDTPPGTELLDTLLLRESVGLGIGATVLFFSSVMLYFALYNTRAPWVYLILPGLLFFSVIVLGNASVHRSRLRHQLPRMARIISGIAADEFRVKTTHYLVDGGTLVAEMDIRKKGHSERFRIQLRYEPTRPEGARSYLVVRNMAPVVVYNENRTLISDLPGLDMFVLAPELKRAVSWIYTRYHNNVHCLYIDMDCRVMDRNCVVPAIGVALHILGAMERIRGKDLRWPRKLDDGVLDWITLSDTGGVKDISGPLAKGKRPSGALPLSNHRRGWGPDVSMGIIMLIFTLTLLPAVVLSAFTPLGWIVLIPCGVLSLVLILAFSLGRHLTLPSELKRAALQKAKLIR